MLLMHTASLVYPYSNIASICVQCFFCLFVVLLSLCSDKDYWTFFVIIKNERIKI